MAAAQITIVDMSMMVRMADCYLSLSAESMEEMSADVKVQEIDC